MNEWKRRVGRLALIAAICAGLSAFTTAADVIAQSGKENEEKATVYIYKGWHVNTLWRAAFAVYMNEKMIARLDRGIYLIAKLPPGHYEFRTKNRRAGGVELDVKSGETYYLRMDTESGAQVTNPRLSLVPREQSSFDLKQMKPIEPKDVKDKSVVLTDYSKA